MRATIVLLGATAVLTACGGSREATESPRSGAEVSGVAIQMERIPVTVPVEGSVVSRNRAEITTRMMARVSGLAVDIGSRVKKGDLLISLGTEDVSANQSKAEAAVTVSQAARDEAARHATRMDTLLSQDVVAQVQRDQAHLMLTAAEAQLAMARASLKEVATAASYASIRAPFSGEIVSRYIDEGDVAAPGYPLLVLEESGPREAKLSVPAEAAARLHAGDSIEVTALDGLRTMARVRAVASGVDPYSKTAEVRAVLPADWPTGISVTGLVPVGSSMAVTVPASAVVRRGQLTGVRVVTPQGAVLRWVRLGRSVAGGERVEVLSGLEAGDEIVL